MYPEINSGACRLRLLDYRSEGDLLLPGLIEYLDTDGGKRKLDITQIEFLPPSDSGDKGSNP